MTWQDKKSNYEDAKLKVTYSRAPRQYVTCTNPACRGWEWSSNRKTHCRERGCNAPLRKQSARGASLRRPRSFGSYRSSDKSSAVPDELQSLLVAKLPELQTSCPETADLLAKHVPAPPTAPVALLHGPQSACQKAFKKFQAAEASAASLELEVNDLLADVRQKVHELAETQASLSDLRVKYDGAAQAAQLEVQKTRVHAKAETGNEQVTKLAEQLNPDQLESMAANLVRAAKESREKENETTERPPSPTLSDLTRLHETNTGMQNDALQDASKACDASKDASMGIQPASSDGSVLPSVIAGNGRGFDGAQNVSVDVQTSPQGFAQRAGSRSPRRSKQSPSPAGGCKPPDGKKKDTSPPPESPPHKAARASKVDDAANARSCSTSGKSAGSNVEAKPAAHYAAIMQGVEQEAQAALASSTLAEVPALTPP